MTPEEKDLLLKDLCGRLPYKVKIQVNNTIETLESVRVPDSAVEYRLFYASNIENVKPYLYPLSSMTEEQKYTCPIGVGELENFIKKDNWGVLTISPNEIIPFVSWLNKNHFDYRGLIEKGFAIDSTNLNIYNTKRTN